MGNRENQSDSSRGKAPVLVTRRLPQAVEARLQRDYAARLNTQDTVYTGKQIIELSAGVGHFKHYSLGSPSPT